MEERHSSENGAGYVVEGALVACAPTILHTPRIVDEEGKENDIEYHLENHLGRGESDTKNGRNSLGIEIEPQATKEISDDEA